MLNIFQQQPSASITTGYQYFLSIPSDYENNGEKEKLWPLLLFLHGAGESHPPIEKILKHGPPKLIHTYIMNKSATDQSSNQLDTEVGKFIAENFITCSPQVDRGYGWNDQMLLDLINQVTKNYHVDPDRIYCTGISMGGYGTWSLALAASDLFAAIIPICGGGDVQRVACLRHLPIWNFHGELDDVIPVERSLVLVKALDSPLCKSTVYPHLKHDSWTETYKNKEIFIWLLQQTKSKVRH